MKRKVVNPTSFFSNCRPRGFTLIESLVVVGVFAIIAVISTQILFSTLKGSSKSEAEIEVRQNGSYALSVITQMVRNARSVTPDPGGGIRIQNPDQKSTIFSCGGNSIASNSAQLTNTTKVSVTNCGITLNDAPPGGGPPTVTIGFTVSTNTASTRPEDKAQMPFSATVTLRNY